jgi:DNA processing protein
MDALHAWIRLTKLDVSPLRLNRLLDHFGSPENAFAASAAEVRAVTGCSTRVAERLLDPGVVPSARELKLMEQLKVRLVTRDDPEYPFLLGEIADPPPAVYVRGTLHAAGPDCPDAHSIALVGSRRCSEYGKRVTDRFARELVAAGCTIISGLARGIDTAAHQAALAAGGRTIACLGCGIDVAYPPENFELAQRIVQSGALVSEYPMMAAPDAWNFPRRNRIISGLCLGTVVVEAPARSGALHTAEFALEQNREVFAVPGTIDNYRSAGTNRLIKIGAAKLVQEVGDILCELRQPAAAQPALDLGLEAPSAPEIELPPNETRLLALLSDEPQPVDDLILETELPASAVNAALLMLELHGLARRLPGHCYVRT